MTVTQLPTQTFEAAAEAGVERVAEILNGGAVAIMLSIGHRLGLFDALADMPPSTSVAIAQRTELNERYVREWLAVMVTGQIINFDPALQTYALDPAQAACLTRGASHGNMAVYAQFIAIMGDVQDRLLNCFETGDGTVYDDYPCFHQIMAEDSAMSVQEPLFDAILPLIPGIAARLEAGIDVLDAGCGRGAALRAMAARYPASRFVGYDLSPDAVAFANDAANGAGLTNVTFTVRDLSSFDELEAYDFITTFDAVHDQKAPQDFLRRLHAALRPGGTYLMQDIGGSARLENNMEFPMAPLLYAISCSHCMPISLGQGGDGLGTMWGRETAEAMLRDAGFRDVNCNVLPHDPMNVWFVSNAPAVV